MVLLGHEYVDGHAWHANNALAPTAWLNVPAGHGKGAVLFAGQYAPCGHCTGCELPLAQ
jgi:hypothetical protein